jgi:hypothetical protein
MTTKIRRIFLSTVLVIAGAFAFVCIVVQILVGIYYSIVPSPPLPTGAQLLSRNPEQGRWTANNGRAWYYAKYAIAQSPEQVRAYFKNKGYRAEPWGYFTVEILPPTPPQDEPLPNMRISSALRRDPSDPKGETIILIQVDWNEDWPLSPSSYFDLLD